MTALTLWRLNWCNGVNIGCATKDDSLPYNALDALLSVKETKTYSSLQVVVEILTIPPVTTATNERLFSAMKYLKTYLPSTMKKLV